MRIFELSDKGSAGVGLDSFDECVVEKRLFLFKKFDCKGNCRIGNETRVQNIQKVVDSWTRTRAVISRFQLFQFFCSLKIG